jgi:hypothetical protein
MSLKLGGADDSSPDLIVHGVLGMERSMDQIREEMRGILERLVRLQYLFYSSSSLLHLCPGHDDTACLPTRFPPIPLRSKRGKR